MPIARPVHWMVVSVSSPKRKAKNAVMSGDSARNTLVWATPRCLMAYAQVVNAVALHRRASASVG